MAHLPSRIQPASLRCAPATQRYFVPVVAEVLDPTADMWTALPAGLDMLGRPRSGDAVQAAVANIKEPWILNVGSALVNFLRCKSQNLATLEVT